MALTDVTLLPLPFVHRYRDRHGTERFYLRRPGHKNIALSGLPGTPEFLASDNVAVEGGCSAHQIASITGHKTLAEVERYTRAVDQEHLARSAILRMTATKPEREVANPIRTASLTKP